MQDSLATHSRVIDLPLVTTITLLKNYFSQLLRCISTQGTISDLKIWPNFGSNNGLSFRQPLIFSMFISLLSLTYFYNVSKHPMIVVKILLLIVGLVKKKGRTWNSMLLPLKSNWHPWASVVFLSWWYTWQNRCQAPNFPQLSHKEKQNVFMQQIDLV